MLKFSPTDKKTKEDQAAVAGGFQTYQKKKKENKDHACTEKELVVMVVRLYRYANLRDFGVD